MLLTQVQTELRGAIKSKDDSKKGILRLVIGEASQTNVTKDDDVYKIMRKLIDRNRETMSFYDGKEGHDDKISALKAEIVILETFLPRMLSQHEIRSCLIPITQQIRDAKEGAAIGVAMKYIKGKDDGAQIDGKDVRQVVTELRASDDK